MDTEQKYYVYKTAEKVSAVLIQPFPRYLCKCRSYNNKTNPRPNPGREGKFLRPGPGGRGLKKGRGLAGAGAGAPVEQYA